MLKNENVWKTYFKKSASFHRSRKIVGNISKGRHLLNENRSLVYLIS